MQPRPPPAPAPRTRRRPPTPRRPPPPATAPPLAAAVAPPLVTVVLVASLCLRSPTLVLGSRGTRFPSSPPGSRHLVGDHRNLAGTLVPGFSSKDRPGEALLELH